MFKRRSVFHHIRSWFFGIFFSDAITNVVGILSVGDFNRDKFFFNIFIQITKL
jgi:hypothetical protein